MGKDEFLKFKLSNYSDRSLLIKADDLFRKAVSLDKNFASAYSGLAYTYLYKNLDVTNSYFSENYLDSCLILSEKALSIDSHFSEAYVIKGFYYFYTNKNDKILAELEKALKYNPNYYDAYYNKALLYLVDYYQGDFVQAIENFKIALSLNHSSELPFLIRSLGECFGLYSGFPDRAKECYLEALKIDGDSSEYYYKLGQLEALNHHFSIAIEYYERALKAESNNVALLMELGNLYTFEGNVDYVKALNYYKMYSDRISANNKLTGNAMHRVGYAYLKNGNKSEAEKWFKLQEKFLIEEEKRSSIDYNYDRAALYAFSGQKEKAYENLKKLKEFKVFPLWWLNLLKQDPFFDELRNEKQFQDILSILERKYNQEHEKVKKWLEENQ